MAGLVRLTGALGTGKWQVGREGMTALGSS
jgi:hypothetical protein